MVEIAQVVGTADKNLVQKWNSKLFSCNQLRQPFERQWHQNAAFYFDRQWIVISSRALGNAGFTLAEAPVEDKWRVRHTANRVKRIIRTELTKLSKEEPQFYCLPASTDESDRAAAMAGDTIADWLMHNKYFNKKRMEATFWACICGTGFLKNWYDETKLELDGQPGKIDFDAVTAFHLFVPYLQVSDIQEQPYVVHAKAMSPEDVYTSYGVDCKPSQGQTSTIIDSRFQTTLGIKNTKNAEASMVYVKECWVRPCREFPNGAMFVVSDNEFLYSYEPPVDPTVEGTEQLPSGTPQQLQLPVGTTGDPSNEPSQDHIGNAELVQFDIKGMQGRKFEFPYTHGRFPFAKIDHVPTGMFYAESVIKALIPLQKEYNRTRSIMLETRNLAGKPQWSYIKGSIDPKHFTAKPGLLLAVNLGFDAPKALEQPPLPPNVPQELEVIQRDMDDVSSQFEIAKGRTPPGVEAASAIAYLQEENDTTLHHTVVSLEAAVQETGVQVLANVHDFWSEERIIALTSKNQSYEIKKFKGAGLNPLTDFRVESGSMAPRSTAAKQAFITELVKMQVIDFKQAAKYLQMSETTKMYEEMLLDDRHAQRENMRMADGEPLTKMGEVQEVQDPTTGMTMPQQMPEMAEELDEYGMPTGEMYIVTTNPFDNHEAHIRVHEDYEKTQEYEMLPREIQMVFLDHVDEHKKELLKQRNALDSYNNNMASEPMEQPPSTDQPVENAAPATNGDMANA